jgi:phospholipid-binding lipoprotein MlaA
MNRGFSRRWTGRILSSGFVWFGLTLAHSQGPASPGAPSIFEEDPSTLVAPAIPDKIEGVNRVVFKFNDALYQAILQPLAKGYAAVVATPIRRGLGHFFHNLEFPTRFVGNILEARLANAGVETERFAINTVTSLGFLTLSDKFPRLQERPSDLGQAFGTWGLGHGTYLILPLLGPSSLRDGVGLALSGYFLDPLHYLNSWKYRTGGTVVSIVNQSPEQMQAYDQLKAAAVDPYVALRDAYNVRRSRRLVTETQVPIVPAAAATAPKF